MIIICLFIYRARSKVIHPGTMLQGGWSRVRLPMKELEFMLDVAIPATL
jgi:hypothetical protein